MSVTDPFGLVGQVLDGQFRIDKLVGEGGFSAVYRGHHQGLGEPIAIKCLKLPPTLPQSLVDTFIQRFRDESRILYRLSQGNLHIVRSIAAGTTQTNAGVLVPYMVLEWLEGRSVQNDFTVRRTLGQTGRALDVVLKLFETAADGLAYAHSQGVAHRDLNPGNLFLAQTQQGLKMKVLDFGVAKLMHDGALDMGPRSHTVGQIKIFAPAYGAPEQFDDRIGKVSSASDVYSFALVLIEALRDKSINEGSHIGEFAQAACDPAKRPTPRFYGVDVPEEVEAAFARATRLDPKERWQTVGDFWQSLTIANKVAVERRYETAARETPPLAMGNGPQPPAPVAPQAPQAAKATAKSNVALTMPLGSQQPPLPRPGGANAPRPRTPTTIGIPPPAGGLQRPPTAPIGQNPAATAKTVAFAATEPGPPPPSNRSSSIPTQVAAPPPVSSNQFVDLPSQDPLPEEEDEDEATKVHAPAPEMLRTLAFNQGGAQMQQARAQADAMIAAQRAAAAQAGAAPPPKPPYVDPNEDIEEPPDSGGTLMMAPAARQQMMSSTIGMPQAPPPPGIPTSTIAMASPIGTPGFPALPGQSPESLLATRAMDVATGPVVAAPGMQGIPGAHGTPPQGMPAVRAPFPSQPHAPPVLAPQGPPPPQPQQPSYAQPQHQPSFAQQPPPPSVAQPQPSLAATPPVKPLPIVPIVAVLAVLALGGLVLGGLALRSRSHPVGPDGALSASASAAAAAITPVPVEPTPPASASAAAVAEEAADAAPATVDLDDAAVAAVATAPDAAPTPTTPTTTTTAVAATNPPPTGNPVAVAPPTPTKPAADPNAFSESGARGKLGTASGVLAFCKHEGGVTGPGSANVTFAPDGSVSSVGIDPPYAGTKEGDCVASQFRRVKITPFTGNPATVKFPFDVPK